jgi:hypothetical protein
MRLLPATLTFAFLLQGGSQPATRPLPPIDRTLVVPRACATERAGKGNNNIPFSWKPVRYQACLAPEVFEFDGTLGLAGIGLRLADGHTESNNSAEVELEIALARGPRDLADVTATFADNIARDRLVVVPRRKIEVGRSANRGGAVPEHEVWDLHIPFQHVFAYKTDSVLVLEVRVFGNSRGDQHFVLPLEASTDERMKRIYGELDQEQGTLQKDFGLVMRFDVVAARGKDLNAAAARPAASQPASRPGSQATR